MKATRSYRFLNACGGYWECYHPANTEELVRAVADQCGLVRTEEERFHAKDQVSHFLACRSISGEDAATLRASLGFAS